MEELQVEGHFDIKQMRDKWEFQLEIKNQIPGPGIPRCARWPISAMDSRLSR
jgi:hypothetical protein